MKCYKGKKKNVCSNLLLFVSKRGLHKIRDVYIVKKNNNVVCKYKVVFVT